MLGIPVMRRYLLRALIVAHRQCIVDGLSRDDQGNVTCVIMLAA